MEEELKTKEKERDHYKERMTEMEERIRQLNEMLYSENIHKEILERKLEGEVDGAKSTADTVQNLTNEDEMIRILIRVSKHIAKLDDANREKHPMMFKSDIASQDIKRLQESVRKLKSISVSSG